MPESAKRHGGPRKTRRKSAEYTQRAYQVNAGNPDFSAANPLELGLVEAGDGSPQPDSSCELRLLLVRNGAPISSPPERCQSGRSGRSRKPLCVQAYRGFES